MFNLNIQKLNKYFNICIDLSQSLRIFQEFGRSYLNQVFPEKTSTKNYSMLK